MSCLLKDFQDEVVHQKALQENALALVWVLVKDLNSSDFFLYFFLYKTQGKDQFSHYSNSNIVYSVQSV